MASASDLQYCWQRLHDTWERSGQQWNDEVSLRIERDFFNDYERLILRAIDSMEQLEHVLSQAEREVH